MSFMMHGAMGGPHHFSVHLVNNDPAWDEKTLQVISDWVE